MTGTVFVLIAQGAKRLALGDRVKVLAPLIKREILWRVVTSEQGAAVRQLGLADSGLTHVAAAVRWIRDHHAESFGVEDVARLSGMSVSAFTATSRLSLR
jgi:hypothetical protein